MFGTKLRTNLNGNGCVADETIRRVTREKVVVRGNTTIRTMDSTTSFLPLIERFVHFEIFHFYSIICKLHSISLPIKIFIAYIYHFFFLNVFYGLHGVSSPVKWWMCYSDGFIRLRIMKYRMLFSKQTISLQLFECQNCVFGKGFSILFWIYIYVILLFIPK